MASLNKDVQSILFDHRIKMWIYYLCLEYHAYILQEVTIS